MWGEAIVALHKYLDNPQANWVNERCYAMRLLGASYAKLQSFDQAEHWLKMACHEAPQTREPWIDAAEYFYAEKKWQECLNYAEAGLKIERKEDVYTMNPAVWGSKPFDFAAIAAYNLGQYNKAVEYGSKACELSPEDNRLQSNLSYYLKSQNESFAN